MQDALPRQLLDRLEIRELIDNWVLWRDGGEWERLRTLWHADGRMVTTWCEVGVEEFIGMCMKAWHSGAAINAVHSLGGMNIDIAGRRAVAQTRMMLTQRAPLDGVLVDVSCTGRFYDLLERRNERWGLVLRHPIYEMDRIDVVNPSATLVLNQALLSELPAGYRHLAYLQISLGFDVNRNLPGKAGPALQRLYDEGRAWLAGGGDLV